MGMLLVPYVLYRHLRVLQSIQPQYDGELHNAVYSALSGKTALLFWHSYRNQKLLRINL